MRRAPAQRTTSIGLINSAPKLVWCDLSAAGKHVPLIVSSACPPAPAAGRSRRGPPLHRTLCLTACLTARLTVWRHHCWWMRPAPPPQPQHAADCAPLLLPCIAGFEFSSPPYQTTSSYPMYAQSHIQDRFMLKFETCGDLNRKLIGELCRMTVPNLR